MRHKALFCKLYFSFKHIFDYRISKQLIQSKSIHVLDNLNCYALNVEVEGVYIAVL